MTLAPEPPVIGSALEAGMIEFWGLAFEAQVETKPTMLQSPSLGGADAAEGPSFPALGELMRPKAPVSENSSLLSPPTGIHSHPSQLRCSG